MIAAATLLINFHSAPLRSSRAIGASLAQRRQVTSAAQVTSERASELAHRHQRAAFTARAQVHKVLLLLAVVAVVAVAVALAGGRKLITWAQASVGFESAASDRIVLCVSARSLETAT